MIIQCQNCKTKFKLEDDKIKVTGSRVKCSKCSNIFVVYKPADMAAKEGFLDESSPPVNEKEEASSDETETSTISSFEEEKAFDVPFSEPQKKEEDSAVKESSFPTSSEKEEFTLGKKEPEIARFSFELAEEDKAVPRNFTIDKAKEIKKDEFNLKREERINVESRSSFSPSIFIVIALVVFLGLASGYLTLYLISNYSLNFSLKDFKISYSEKETSIKNIKIVNLKTNYLLNTRNEKLLVVRGDFKNISSSSFSTIEYKVTVFGVKGEILQEREMKYISLSEALDIVNLSWQEVNLKIQKKEEKGIFSSSSKVLEANSIKPFIVVFKDIDPSAKEVKVEIIGGG